MKTVFKFLALAAVSAITAAPLLRADEPASTPPAPGEHARPNRAEVREHRLQKLDEKLQLTDAQKQQITAIWSAAEQQGKTLRADTSLTQDDRRAKMHDAMKASHDQIRALLTPDQQKTFDAMPRRGMREHRGHHKDGGDKPDADKPADDTQKQ